MLLMNSLLFILFALSLVGLTKLAQSILLLLKTKKMISQLQNDLPTTLSATRKKREEALQGCHVNNSEKEQLLFDAKKNENAFMLHLTDCLLTNQRVGELAKAYEQSHESITQCFITVLKHHGLLKIVSASPEETDTVVHDELSETDDLFLETSSNFSNSHSASDTETSDSQDNTNQPNMDYQQLEYQLMETESALAEVKMAHDDTQAELASCEALLFKLYALYLKNNNLVEENISVQAIREAIKKIEQAA